MDSLKSEVGGLRSETRTPQIMGTEDFYANHAISREWDSHQHTAVEFDKMWMNTDGHE
jgi:hypothetical protein